MVVVTVKVSQKFYRLFWRGWWGIGHKKMFAVARSTLVVRGGSIGKHGVQFHSATDLFQLTSVLPTSSASSGSIVV